jgi:flagellar biosynthesis regulator FlaF
MAMFQVQTSVKATTEEFEHWKRAAEAANMPVRTWIRCVLDAASGQSELFMQLQKAMITQQLEKAASMRSHREIERG